MFQFFVAAMTFLVTVLLAPVNGVFSRIALGLKTAAHVLEA